MSVLPSTASEPARLRCVPFDFKIDLSKGRGLQSQSFRLDGDGAGDRSEVAALAEGRVRDQCLLRGDRARVLSKQVFMENYKSDTEVQS